MANKKQDTEPIEIERKVQRKSINRIMDKPNPMLREKPSLKLAESLSPEEVESIKRAKLKRRAGLLFPFIIFMGMVIVGNYILFTYRFHSYTRTSSIYVHNGTEISNYEIFGRGIIRFNREGVVFLNNRNQEQWVWPSQFNNPTFIASDQSFAIIDRGGNGIQVFNEGGLIGEFETSFPIERATLSNQGIVSAVLKGNNEPMIMTFDVVGNILVEMQAPLATMGYPTALALSRDGMTLAVGYLSVNGGRIRSNVIHYNFANVSGSYDFVVGYEEFDDRIIVELYFTSEGLTVAITDTSFVIFEEIESLSIREHVFIEEGIVGVFYTNEYIGYLLLDKERVGYELRLYNLYSEVVMTREFIGEYSNIRKIGNDIIMFDGFGLCIISRQGVIRFQGNLEVNPALVMPAFGVNRFYVMSESDLRIITLVR